MKQPPNIRQYLSGAQAAKHLGIGYTSFYEWRKNKKLDLRAYTHPVTGRAMYLKKDIDILLEKMEGSNYVDF